MDTLVHIEAKTELTKHLFLPLSIFIVALGCLFISSFYLHEQEHLEIMAHKNSIRTFKEFDQKFENDVSMYTEMIKLIAKDQKAIRLFSTKNKEELYEYFKYPFKEWKEKYNVTHFYFHNADQTNFVRIHNFENDGDYINRSTLKRAVESNNISTGIKFDITHNLTLRVVYPWLVDNTIIGYIELGKEIDYFTPELSQLSGVEIIFTINKNLISQDDYALWLVNSKNNTKFKILEHMYIITSTINQLDKALLKELDKEIYLSNTKIKNFHKNFYLHSKDFIDANQNIIGKMVILEEFTDENTLFILTIFKTSSIVVILTLILLIYYFYLLKKEENTIDTQQKKFIDLSIKDSLTGIFNRRYFDIKFDTLINNQTLYNQYISLILIDIDHFKEYNDTYGHKQGDEVLIAIATTMHNCLNRVDDHCFRIGGEEFAILLASSIKEFAEELAEKIRHSVEKLNIDHDKNENYNNVTISLGVYTKKYNPTIDKKIFFNEADALLYDSKEKGRNKVSSKCVE